MPDLPDIVDPSAPLLRVGVAPFAEPFAYVGADGRPTGLDIELVRRLAHALGMRLAVNADYGFMALIPALLSGREDALISSITITEERRRRVDFSVPYVRDDIVALARDESAAAAPKSWWTSLRDDFHQNFVVDDRYRMILQGLKVTLLITVAAAILGGAAGLGLSLLARMRNRWVRRLVAAYVSVLQGTPVLVLLMILYYLVFPEVEKLILADGRRLDPVWVAVLGFAMNFAAYGCEIFRTSFDTVPRGEIEAARAMGFGAAGAFTLVTLPQAARYALPVFRGEVVSMLKMTSIVGYIAIQDLTRAGDIIRSLTYQAFFPLICTAVLYYLLARLLILGLNRLARPRARRS